MCFEISCLWEYIQCLHVVLTHFRMVSLLLKNKARYTWQHRRTVRRHTHKHTLQEIKRCQNAFLVKSLTNTKSKGSRKSRACKMVAPPKCRCLLVDQRGVCVKQFVLALSDVRMSKRWPDILLRTQWRLHLWHNTHRGIARAYVRVCVLTPRE